MLPSDYFFSKEIFLQFLQLPWVLAITLSCRQQKISWQPCGGRGPQISPEATLGVLKVHRWTQNSRALRQKVILATGLECISLPPKAFWRHWRDLFGLRSYFILDLFLSFDVHITGFSVGGRGRNKNHTQKDCVEFTHLLSPAYLSGERLLDKILITTQDELAQ